MPNIIHSLDATTIALLYKDWQKIGCLYTVHDCFATTANLVPLLINSLKFVYIRLYSDTDYLIQFDELVKTNINKQFGDKVYNMKNNHVCILTQGKDLVIQLPDINKVLNLKGYEKDKIHNLFHEFNHNSLYILDNIR
jgi:DNA-directed RNA polymerase